MLSRPQDYRTGPESPGGAACPRRSARRCGRSTRSTARFLRDRKEKHLRERESSVSSSSCGRRASISASKPPSLMWFSTVRDALRKTPFRHTFDQPQGDWRIALASSLQPSSPSSFTSIHTHTHVTTVQRNRLQRRTGTRLGQSGERESSARCEFVVYDSGRIRLPPSTFRYCSEGREPAIIALTSASSPSSVKAFPIFHW